MPTISLTNNTGLDITASSADGNATLNRYLKEILTFKTPPSLDQVANQPVSSLHELAFPIKLAATAVGKFAVEGATLSVQVGASASIGLLQGSDEATFFSLLNMKPDAGSSGLVSFALTGTVSAGPTVGAGDFAFGITNNTAITLTSFYQAAAKDSLGVAVQKALSTLTVPHDIADLQSLRPGAICQLDAAGSLSFSVSLTYSFLNDPLAAASIDKLPPFSINATAGATLEATATHIADHTLTIARLQNGLFQLSVSLTKTDDFETSLTVSAGLAANIGTQDALAFLLDKINPGSASEADAIASQMPDAAAFKADIKAAIDSALSAALGVSLKAGLDRSTARNRLFVFEIDLDRLDGQARTALQAALAGDFIALTKAGAKLAGITQKDSGLSYVTSSTHALALHLVGIFNASSINQFVSASTVDFTKDTHELVLSDESIQARINNLDGEKLRRLVLKDITLTLPASANTPEVPTPITLVFLRREASTKPSTLRQFANVLAHLGAADAAEAQTLLSEKLTNYGVCSTALALSLNPAQCGLLFAGNDGANGWWAYVQQFCQAERLILSGDPDSQFRLRLFQADQKTWSDLRDAGASANMMPILRSIGILATQAELVVTDVITGLWWAAAMSAYASALAKRQSLAAAGKEVVRDANLGFNEPWMILAAWNMTGRPAIKATFVTSQTQPKTATARP